MSPHCTQSNGFIKRQVRTIKTALNMMQTTIATLDTLLLYLWSMPIGPHMLSLRQILHNRTLECPGNLPNPTEMEIF